MRASELQNAPEFSEIVVASNGSMARMHTIDSRTFAKFKRWMAGPDDRDPIERRRDRMQADAVDWLVSERLPQMSA